MATALPETAQEGFKNTQTQSFFRSELLGGSFGGLNHTILNK